MIGPLRTYHGNYERNIVQLNANFSQYDSLLSYTLKPGSFTFSNREFDKLMHVNSLGVRDDEKSIMEPEIVVLGDSHAMGWGVENDSSFVSLIEANTGKVVLNTAISSFGTYRQFEILERIDTRKTQYLIIQYCENDYRENITAINNSYVLPVMSKQAFDSLMNFHMSSRQYYFGKHSSLLTKTIINGFARRISKNKPKPEETYQAVDAFLNILKENADIIYNKRIIVFEINEFGKFEDNFASKLMTRLNSDDYNSINKQISVIDFRGIIDEQHCFTLDGHMMPTGHKIVANEICNRIRLSQEQ